MNRITAGHASGATLWVTLLAVLACGGDPPPEPKITRCSMSMLSVYKPEDPLVLEFLCNVYPKDLWTHATLTVGGEVLGELDNPGTKSTRVDDQFRFRADVFADLPLAMVEANEFTFEVEVDIVLEDGQKRTLRREETKSVRVNYYKVERVLKKRKNDAARAARDAAPKLSCTWTECKIENTDCSFGYVFDEAKRSIHWQTNGTCPEIRVGGEIPETKEKRCRDFALHSMTVDAIRERGQRLLDITMDGVSITDKGAPGPFNRRRTEQATVRFPLFSCLYPSKDGQPVRYAGEPPKRGKPYGMLLVGSRLRSATLGEVSTAADIDLLGHDGTDRRSVGCTYVKGEKRASRSLSMTDRWAKVYDRRTGRLVAQKTWKARQARCQSSARVTVKNGTTSVGAGFDTEVPLDEVIDFYEAALKR